MSTAVPTSDADLLDLLRALGPMDVAAMSSEFEVTPTAVRQRLSRLLAQGFVDREPVRHGRGRPKHRYQLTQQGLRLTGSNCPDLALALWREIGTIEDFEVRRTVLRRVVKTLAATLRPAGPGPHDRGTNAVSGRVARRAAGPRSRWSRRARRRCSALHACPYPELAGKDRAICAMERVLFSELVGADLQLAQWRLDGGGSASSGPCSGRLYCRV